MLLMHKPSGTLVEILTLDRLFNPCIKEVMGVTHAGEELQEPDSYMKWEMMFPSGESLPRCWLDSHYRDTEHYIRNQEFSVVGNG